MRTAMNNLTNLSAIDTDYFNDKQAKIELVSNTKLSKECKKYLSIVNESFYLADIFRRDKDFSRAIVVLKDAYIATFELTGPVNLRYAEFFRSTILESLESIHRELKYLSGRLIKRKRFLGCYQMVGNILEKLEEIGKNSNSRVKKDIKHFIESYHQKNVS